MAKAFAKAFYNSVLWKSCRDSYIAERIKIDGGLCECCHEKPGEEVHHEIFLTPDNINDPEITLNFDHLAYLCKDCHNREHEKAVLLGLRKMTKQARIINENGYYFDENGDVQPQRIYVVYGAPASGKTTYVRNHKQPDDLVVDLDLIRQSITMAEKSELVQNLLGTVISIRDFIYSLIEDKKIDCRNIWIIAGLPKKKQRLELIQRFNAEPVFMYATKAECMKRANDDDERKDKHIQHAIISKWFEDFEM